MHIHFSNPIIFVLNQGILTSKNEDYPSRHKDVVKTSYKRLNFGLKDVLDWSEMKVATTFFQDVVKMSPRRRFQDIMKTSSGGLENVFRKTS